MEFVNALTTVPYSAQFEDIDRIADYINGTRSLLDDPCWQRSGAQSPEAYAYWANRACGMVCVKMCVEAFGGEVLPLRAWIERGLAINAYLTEKRSNNTTIEKGWLHAGLAQVMIDVGLQAVVQSASVHQVVQALRAGSLVIASVSYEIGTELPITHKGGHLVTVIGAAVENEDVRKIILHNPSGRSAALRQSAQIEIDRFQQAFSGRVIIVDLPH